MGWGRATGQQWNSGTGDWDIIESPLVLVPGAYQGISIQYDYDPNISNCTGYSASILGVVLWRGKCWRLFSVTWAEFAGAFPCDCINGECLPQSTHNTSGAYGSVEECRAGCAQNSQCNGECVNPAEITALRQALTALQARICT